ncbi:MAG: metal-sulfur cluster assembly factor [Gemmatimonadota bacterium]|nr:metal-sulfur cluster assembly factor [Gemmatimonadota bacterium]
MTDPGHPNAGTSPGAAAPGASANGGAGAAPAAEAESITSDLVKLALRRVKDPEVNLNIVDMGLIYDIRVDGPDVAIDMSLTTPACPSGPQIMEEAESALKQMDGVGKVELNLVWSPPWSPERIEPRVRAYLGF